MSRRRLVVTGSRLLTADDHADAIQRGLIHAGKLLGRDALLVHGNARGADTLARLRWERWGLDALAYPAYWDRHGIRAGHIRNAAMLRDGADMVMCWPSVTEYSRGTWGCVQLAMDAGVAVFDGWTLTPVLAVPPAPELVPYAGPLPHADALARLQQGYTETMWETAR